MLTQTDLQKIDELFAKRLVVQEKTFFGRFESLEKAIKSIKGDIAHIRKDINMSLSNQTC